MTMAALLALESVSKTYGEGGGMVREDRKGGSGGMPVAAGTGAQGGGANLKEDFYTGGGGRLFFTNDEGQTFVVRAGREFSLLRVNELGARTLASPALVGGTWYWRTARQLLAIR